MQEKFVLEQFDGESVALSLFSDVKNSREIRQSIVEGNVEAGVLTAALVLAPLQVLAATVKAVHAQKNGRLRTRNVNSEIVYNMSASRSIMDSFSKFGIQDDDEAIVVVTLGDSCAQIETLINGTAVPLSGISEFTDTDRIKKVYKIKDAELSAGSLLDAVVSRIASKEFVSY
ncbi:PREDICTED: EKC/KEOPS complex subunit Tprkb-like [Priapulus caudatus]|uniref:EKC/KEOPS complex subunit Tprkb-like n=1 Tax=Priapulus caudatus TaxID=37621 RepID=A0ABM1F2K7_PRICU|nr:PREDICTED: EKC/KEOPS complex subunit Tprkb-like [Priapulus caudatus]